MRTSARMHLFDRNYVRLTATHTIHLSVNVYEFLFVYVLLTDVLQNI